MLNKIISGIIGALLITISTFAVANQEVLPETKPNYPQELDKPSLYWLQMPVICGTSENVIAYLDKHQFQLVNVSFGRDKAKPDGDPVFVVQYFVDPTYTQSIVVMTTMSGVESCMLYKSFDLKFMPQKQGISL